MLFLLCLLMLCLLCCVYCVCCVCCVCLLLGTQHTLNLQQFAWDQHRHLCTYTTLIWYTLVHGATQIHLLIYIYTTQIHLLTYIYTLVQWCNAALHIHNTDELTHSEHICFSTLICSIIHLFQHWFAAPKLKTYFQNTIPDLKNAVHLSFSTNATLVLISKFSNQYCCTN